jgi:hypothetical protein
VKLKTHNRVRRGIGGVSGGQLAAALGGGQFRELLERQLLLEFGVEALAEAQRRLLLGAGGHGRLFRPQHLLVARVDLPDEVRVKLERHQRLLQHPLVHERSEQKTFILLLMRFKH